MIERSCSPASWIAPRAARARATGAGLLLSALVLACKPPASDPDCVSVGMGWRACSDDMQAQETGGTGARALTMDPPAKPAQTGDQGGSAGAGRTLGADGRQGGSAGASSAGAGLPTATANSVDAGARTASAATTSAAGSAGSSDAGTSGAGGAGESGSAGRAGASGESASAGHSGAGGSASGAAGAAGLPTTCCHSLGVCVEHQSLSEDQRSLLVADSCAGRSELCAPTAVLSAQGYVPKTCRSVLQGEGRCLADCMAGLAGQRDKLPRDTCDTHELCAPCFDPITGSATGSCRLGADPGPRELPHTFRGCCLDGTGAPQGMCVPRSYIPAGAAATQADCGAELFCVPRQHIIDPNAKPVECSTDIRGPGICLPQCIADSLA